MTETPGVVATVGTGEHVDCSIYGRAIRHPVAPVTEANFLKLRTEWQTPDGWELMTAVDVWRHAQELVLGLHYVRVNKEIWQCLTPLLKRSARLDAPTVQRILSAFAPMIARVRALPSAVADIRSTDFVSAMVSLKDSISSLSRSVLADVTFAADRRAGTDSASTTITLPESFEAFSAFLATEQSGSSRTARASLQRAVEYLRRS